MAGLLYRKPERGRRTTHPPLSQRTKINGRRVACAEDPSLHTLPPPRHEGRASRVVVARATPPERVGGGGRERRHVRWRGPPRRVVARRRPSPPCTSHGPRRTARCSQAPSPCQWTQQERSARAWRGLVWHIRGPHLPNLPCAGSQITDCRPGGRPLRAAIAPAMASRPMEPDPGRLGDQNGLFEWPMRRCPNGRTNPREYCATHSCRLGGSVGAAGAGNPARAACRRRCGTQRR